MGRARASEMQGSEAMPHTARASKLAAGAPSRQAELAADACAARGRSRSEAAGLLVFAVEWADR